MTTPPVSRDADPLRVEPGLERFLLDQVEAAVIATDPAGVVTFWNRHAEVLLGYPAQVALGSNLLDLVIDPADRGAVLGILETLGAGESWEGEIDVHTREGLTVPGRLRASPSYDDAGRFVGMASVLVDITEQRRVELRRSAQYAVTRVLSEAETIAEAAPRILEAVAERIGWDTGALWALDPDDGRLRCVDTWQAPLAKVHEFPALTRQMTFPPGVWLPGRILLSAEPAWIADIVHDPEFTRAPAAAEEDLHGAVAFPIVVGREVLGVVEFFSREIQEPDPDLLQLMTSIGSQIGQFIERTSAREAARRQTERSRERMAFLAEAGALLASSLDHDKTLNKVAKLAVPRLADWCNVELRENGELSPVPEVIRTGRSRLYEEVTDDLLPEIARDPETLETLRSLGARSAMVVPLTARTRTFGAITFVSTSPARRYGPDDLALAEALAERAAQAVDNARLYRERAHVARALQQSLLPKTLPEIERIEVAARYRAAGEAEVGGDFYDVFESRRGAWFAVIGDVQGKGPEAAAVTGLARSTIRAAASSRRSPSRILRTLNQAILNEWTERFATVALAHIQPTTTGARVALACGGHPLPYVLRATGELETANCKGNLLGLFPEVELRDRVLDLEPGDALVMFTDGVTEEHSGKRVFGEDRLEALLLELAGLDAEAIAGRIEQAVLDFGEPEPRDDLAVLVLRLRPDVAPAAEPV